MCAHQSGYKKYTMRNYLQKSEKNNCFFWHSFIAWYGICVREKTDDESDKLRKQIFENNLGRRKKKKKKELNKVGA